MKHEVALRIGFSNVKHQANASKKKILMMTKSKSPLAVPECLEDTSYFIGFGILQKNCEVFLRFTRRLKTPPGGGTIRSLEDPAGHLLILDSFPHELGMCS